MDFFNLTFGLMLPTVKLILSPQAEAVCVCVHARTDDSWRGESKPRSEDKVTVAVNESAAAGGNDFKNWTQKQKLFLGSAFCSCQLFAKEHRSSLQIVGLLFWTFLVLTCKSSLDQQILQTHLEIFFAGSTLAVIGLASQTKENFLIR